LNSTSSAGSVKESSLKLLAWIRETVQPGQQASKGVFEVTQGVLQAWAKSSQSRADSDDVAQAFRFEAAQLASSRAVSGELRSSQ
jgi:hypothetical protein